MPNPNSPSLKSFISVDPASHYPIQNLPFGIFSTRDDPARRAGVAIGDQVLDLSVLEAEGLIRTGASSIFDKAHLNDFLAQGRTSWTDVRGRVSHLLRSDVAELRDNEVLRRRCIVPMSSTIMHRPMRVGGFSDFMLSKEHSLNCVEILGSSGALWPNWHYLPMGYNSRASSGVVSGSPVRRPWARSSRKDRIPRFTVSAGRWISSWRWQS